MRKKFGACLGWVIIHSFCIGILSVITLYFIIETNPWWLILNFLGIMLNFMYLRFNVEKILEMLDDAILWK